MRVIKNLSGVGPNWLPSINGRGFVQKSRIPVLCLVAVRQRLLATLQSNTISTPKPAESTEIKEDLNVKSATEEAEFESALRNLDEKEKVYRLRCTLTKHIYSVSACRNSSGACRAFLNHWVCLSSMVYAISVTCRAGESAPSIRRAISQEVKHALMMELPSVDETKFKLDEAKIFARGTLMCNEYLPAIS